MHKNDKYYIGLDMGTSSLGWAVTDTKYNICRRKGRDMWGVRLFDEAKTAQERRTNRISKRRRNREKVRIGYLKEMFADEINKVDAGFFQRLDDSKFFEEDKNIHQPFALFADTNYTDRDYYKEYPTIFHLRKKLLESEEKQDVRLVYLALLNMYKHRGHFLSANLDGNGLEQFQELYTLFYGHIKNYLDLELVEISESKYLEDMLSSLEYSKSKKAEEIIKYYNISKTKEKDKAEIVKMICGMKGTLSVIFSQRSWEDENKKISLSFEDGNLEDDIIKAEECLEPEEFEILMEMKQLHDWGQLSEIMKGKEGTYKYLSLARVDSYEKHKNDLSLLKKLYKEYIPEKYNSMFRVMEKNNYSAYVGSVNTKNIIERRGEKCDGGEFFKKIKKDLSDIPECQEKSYVLDEIEKGTFLPKQLTSANGVIPNQIHKMEMKKILENAEKYLDFLKEKDESGLTVSERILQMFSFQIPYYIGPISPFNAKEINSKNVWSVRKDGGQVFPWNFEEKIDVKASAENFIDRMVKHCTYISGENVLPKNSLLYEKFMVLNELNNLKINGESIPVELKQKIFNCLLKTEKKVSQDKLIKFLKVEGYIEPKDIPEISGIDGGFTNYRGNYVKFLKIFNTDFLTREQEEIAENIIFWSTVYGDTKKFLKEKIMEEYAEVLDKSQIKRILGYKFKDWGRLSKGLLEIKGADKETGEVNTVIEKMWSENYNLMELIESRQFTFKEAIEEKTQKLESTLSQIEYEDLTELYLSPPVRRMAWQTILALKEITQVMGNAPEKIFVEMARGPEDVKARTVSRKKKFAQLYKSCKDEKRNWSKEIEERDEKEFRSKKLYLYYLQKGRCMYTNEPIDLAQLFDENLYDIDHIYPRHFVKDDSIENNLVLVKKEKNAHKSDSFPIEKAIQIKCHDLWKGLHQGGFITNEKYKRLTRTTEFTEEERAGFISRQLVETRQGTKAITDLFQKTFKDGEIVYVKAGNVSTFRQKFEFFKNREVNDFHHAQDAYLNIVVGNVYNVKFTKNPYNFIRDYDKAPNKNPYHMDKIFNYRVERNGEVAWETKDNGSINIVKQMMKKNTPLVTKRNYEAKGGFADQTIYSAKKAKKANGQGYVPVKTEDERLGNVCRYGGFTKMAGAYFCLVEHTKKGKRIRTLEAVPLYLKEKLNTKEKLENYFKTNKEFLYEEPDVRLTKIKMGSLIQVNGFRLYLTGRSGEQLLVCNAVQMILSSKQTDYIRELKKVYERNDNEDSLRESKIISKEKNVELYQILLEKHCTGIYGKRPNPIGKNLENGFEKFEKLPLEKQIFVLLQILQISKLINQGANLTDIGCSKSTGIATVNKEVTKQKEFKLINQSATGLYETVTDLLKV